MKIELYCKCGAGMQGSVPTPEAAEKLKKIWYSEHQGLPHGDCDRLEARAAFIQDHGYDPECVER